MRRWTIICMNGRISWRSALIVCAVMVLLLGSAFALIGGRQTARFNVSSQRPVVKFHWHGVPPISGLEYYQSGRFLPDDVDLEALVAAEEPYIYDDDALMQEVWLAILRRAMQRWSEVEGSYLRLELVEEAYELPPERGSSTEQDTEQNAENKAVAAAGDQDGDAYLPEEPDNMHLIQVVDDGLFIGAALPWLDEDDLSHIIDCDIMIGKGKDGRPYSAGEYEYTITHELGHCLGLGHPHSSAHAVMSYHRSDHPRMVTSDWELSVSDRAGVIYLYPEPGVLAGETFYTCGSLGAFQLTGRRMSLAGVPDITAGYGYHGWLWWCFIWLPLGLSCVVSRGFWWRHSPRRT